MDAKCLSVVVPTFNEEEIIGQCLTRLTEQLDHILEIIVVDNNSTDATVDIVRSFADRFSEVILVSEERQGLVYARNTGLDAATGPAISRIDSDTLVPPGWAETIVDFLHSDTEKRWAALCGRGEAYGLPYGDSIGNLKKRVGLLRPPRTTKNTVKDVPVLYGSNMTLRRETWLEVRDKVSMRRDVFEDVDCGLCVQESGGRNAFLAHLTVGVSPRRMETSIRGFVTYMLCLPRTLLLHKRFALAAAAATIYLPAITILHTGRLVIIRSYDKETGRFSARNILRASIDRAMP
ncbi:glycosyltransferase family 2 protein [Williamsia sp.]|uniref:glycosyltransferase family 2 protein n=1 Tax=Williamsia sp. TaxID=1872085 RepID=UPI002F9477BF